MTTIFRVCAFINMLTWMSDGLLGPTAFGQATAESALDVDATTALRAMALLDLQKVPRLNSERILEDLATYTYYSAKARVPGATAFYEGELTSQGWRVIPQDIPANPEYRDVLLQKDGYYLRLTVGASGDDGIVGVSLSHLGNIDLATLPRLDNAQPHPASTPVNVNYSTPRSIAEATKFCRAEFSKQGWHEYRDSLAELPEVPHVKQLNFCRNAVRVMVSVVRDPRDPNTKATMVAYMAHFVLPFDVPILPGADRVVLDTIQRRAEYTVLSSTEKAVEYLRQNAQLVGWHEHTESTHVSQESATVLMEGSDKLGFGISMSTIDGKLKVVFERLSFEPRETSQPAEVASDSPDFQDLADAQEPVTPDIGNEFSKKLKDSIQGSVKKELQSVQDELNKSGVKLPDGLLSIFGDDDKSATDVGEADNDPFEDADDDPQEDSLSGVGDADDPIRRDDSEQLANLPRIKSVCKLHYGGTTYELKNALAVRKIESGDPVVMFCQEKLNAGRAQRDLAKKEDPSILDLTGNSFPPAIEVHLQPDYASISCFVDGASINRTSSDFKTEYLVSPQRVRGTVSSAIEDVFGKEFHFEATFDLDFLSSQAKSNPGTPEVLTANSEYDFPIPEDCQGVTQEKSKYKQHYEAQVKAPMAAVVAFYNKELSSRGWKTQSSPINDSAVRKSVWNGPQGTVQLTLSTQDDTTQVQADVRNTKLAEQHGIVPKAGQGKLLLANATEKDVVMVLGKQTFKLPPEKGAQDPGDALKVPVLPGKHRVKVTSAGETTEEELQIAEGSVWGLIAVPGGGAFSHELY